MNQLTKMFDGKQLRIIEQDNETWFIAKDVCDILEIKNSRDAISRLDGDEKGVALTDTPSGKQNMSIVNEFGLYNLVLSSRKSEAKQFKRWITHEVIPSIRKTGKYEPPTNELEVLQQTVNQMVKIDNRVAFLEDHMRIDGVQEKKLQNKAKSIAIESLGGMKSNAYKNISRKVFSKIWKEFNDHFDLPRYSELPRKQFEEGLRFLGMWQPDTSLRIHIQELNQQQSMHEVM